MGVRLFPIQSQGSEVSLVTTAGWPCRPRRQKDAVSDAAVQRRSRRPPVDETKPPDVPRHLVPWRFVMTLGKTIAALVSLTVAATSTAAAQTTTAFKTGESTTGTNKQCYYESLGNQHTQTIVAIGLCPLSVPVRPATTPTPALQPMMITAYKTGEWTAGLTKQCFYNGLGNENTRTIKSSGLCPLSIWVRPRH